MKRDGPDPRLLSRHVRLLLHKARRLASEQLAGRYRSRFRGHGIEFFQVRAYVPGDDIRFIDANVTARSREPHVKEMVEERELTVLFCLDVSASMHFGTAASTKRERAAEVAAVVAFAAVLSGDRVGVLLVSDVVERYVPPGKGLHHAMAAVSLLYGHESISAGSDLGAALSFLMGVHPRRTVLFVLSDFEDFDPSSLAHVSRAHDAVCVVVTDPLEERLEPVGLLVGVDPETGRRVRIPTGSRAAQTGYVERRRARRRDLVRGLRALDVGCLEVSTAREYMADLVAFFRS